MCLISFQNEKCAIYVHKLLNVLPRTENDIRELLMRLSMQLLHRKIKFTASGLFPLDSTLIFTVNIENLNPGIVNAMTFDSFDYFYLADGWSGHDLSHHIIPGGKFDQIGAIIDHKPVNLLRMWIAYCI